ncbi:hypothetical protein [Brasilonema bromeliae]|nr:hypothetical protein [Brasilonema bromeliae]
MKIAIADAQIPDFGEVVGNLAVALPTGHTRVRARRAYDLGLL